LLWSCRVKDHPGVKGDQSEVVEDHPGVEEDLPWIIKLRKFAFSSGGQVTFIKYGVTLLYFRYLQKKLATFFLFVTYFFSVTVLIQLLVTPTVY
jgi:hypothetical protein